MLEKSRNAMFFQWFVCRVSPKVGLLKRRLRGEIKNCTPLWRKAHLEVKMYKTCQFRSTFWSSDVEKMHAAVVKSMEVKMLKNWQCRNTFWSSDVEKVRAAVARSTFRSQNVKKLRVREHFFEAAMSKKCTPLWRNTPLGVKMLKNWGSGSTFCSFDVEQLDGAVARSTFRSQNVKKLRFSEHFLRFWCRKISQVVS